MYPRCISFLEINTFYRYVLLLQRNGRAISQNVEGVISDVENKVKSFKNIPAQNAHFLPAYGAGKEACRHVLKLQVAESESRQHGFLHLNGVAERILEATFFSDFDFSVNAGAGDKRIVQQETAGIAGMNRESV